MIPIALEDRLYEWATWDERMIDSSSLGYPKRTADARLRDGGTHGGTPTTLVPNLDTPRHLRAVDAAVATLPNDLRKTLTNHYRGNEDKTKKHSLIKAHSWFMGALTAAIVATEQNL
jgi:hypothetical protein